MNEPLIIHTDGACSGNPGPGGFAAIVWSQDPERYITTVTGGDPDTTNNRMELSAVIEALRTINTVQTFQHSPVTVRTDSQYIVKAFNDNWIGSWQRNNWRTAKKQPVANRDLWEDLLREIAPHTATFVWVRGHSGDPMNERCDTLAVAQSKSAPFKTTYWVNTSNPLTEAAETPEDANGTEDGAAAPHPQTTSLSQAELILERNQIALTAIQQAISLTKAGTNQAHVSSELEKALRHLETQKDILAECAPPFGHTLASDHNIRALQSIRRSISQMDDPYSPDFAMNEMNRAASILETQNNILTNNGNLAAAPGAAEHNPVHTEPDQLLDQTRCSIDNALHAIKNGRPWTAADELTLALQQIDNHRRLNAAPTAALRF